MAFTWVAFIVQALISSIFLQFYDISSVSILIVVFTSFFLIFDFAKYDLPKQVFVLLLLGYVFRIFLLFFDIYGRDIFLLPNSGYDSEMFHQFAIQGMNTGDYGNGHVYSFVLGMIYSLFGVDKIIGQYFNVLLSIHALLIVYKTMGLYQLTDKTKYIVLILMAFMPNYAIMSSILLRESILIFLAVLSFYCFSKWLIKGKVWFLLPAFGLSLLMAVFHSGSLFLIGGYTIFLILYNQSTQSFNINLRSVLIVLFFIVAFNFIYDRYYDVFFAKFMQVDDVGDVTDVYVMGDAGYAVGLPIGNPALNFVVNTPLRMIYFVLSPLPWDWRGQADIIAFVFSGLFYGGTIAVALREIIMKQMNRQKYILMLLIIVGFGLVFFAWGVSNAGTALRHRDKFIGLVILLLAFLLDERFERQDGMIIKNERSA